MFHYSWGKYSFRAHRCEWKSSPDNSIYIITLFLCRWRLLWWQTFFQISQTWVKDWPRWYSFYHNIVSMQDALRCLLWRLYDSRWGLLWWICFIVHSHTLLIKYLCITWCGSKPLDCSYLLLWIDTSVFYPRPNCLEDYQQFIGDNDHSDEWWTEIFQTENNS